MGYSGGSGVQRGVRADCPLSAEKYWRREAVSGAGSLLASAATLSSYHWHARSWAVGSRLANCWGHDYTRVDELRLPSGHSDDI